MAQKEFFINAIELVDVQGGTNIPTTLLYRPKQVLFGGEALAIARERDEINEDFKVDLGNQKPGSSTVRRFRCADGMERSAGELTADFLHELLSHLSEWLEAREIKKGANILVAEPLAMQEDLVTEGWVAHYRANVRRILQGKGFKNVDFLPEPFAVYQYYRYGEKHPIIAERRKHHALVIDFGGGTFDVCVIETTKEGDINIKQGERLARPISASSNPIGGFFINRVVAEELIRKILAPLSVSGKINKGLDVYRRWRKDPDSGALAPEYRHFVQHFHRLAYRIEEPKLALCRSIRNWALDAPLTLSVPVAAPDDPFATHPSTINAQFSASELRAAFISKIWEQHLRPIVRLALQRGKEELSGAPITAVLLSGGSANIRWLAELLRRDFSDELHQAEILPLKDFQEAVAKGLAVECARRYHTAEGHGDFSTVTYNRLCLILDPDQSGYELKRFVPRDDALPKVDVPGVLLPSASVLAKFKNKPMCWKVHLDSAPRRSLHYYFLRSGFDPQDTQNLQNIEETVLHSPKNVSFDRDLAFELRVSEDGTATPKFVYHLGRADTDSVTQQGRPFFLDMTTGDSVAVGEAYVGLDFGTSNTSLSFVNRTSIEVFERRAQERSWNELSDLASSLPYPLAAPLAHYLCQTDSIRLSTAARDFIESALTLAAYIAYQEYCTKKGRASTRILKSLAKRSAGPIWGLFRNCMTQLGNHAVFSAAYREFLNPQLKAEIDSAVDAIAKFKHGKVGHEGANPIRVVQVLANVSHLAFHENTFGMFQDVEKRRFSKDYEGVFRRAHGRPSFVSVESYAGSVSFSNNECYVLNATNRRALPMEPLIVWESCPKHPELENGHCFLFDTAEASGTFSYKAVGFTCTLEVDASTNAPLAQRLRQVCQEDEAIDEVKV